MNLSLFAGDTFTLPVTRTDYFSLLPCDGLLFSVAR